MCSLTTFSVCLFRRFLVQGHHRRQPFHERRMRVMVHAVQGIGAHGTQVLEVNLAQSTLQVLAHVQVDGKLIRSEFAVTTEDRQHKGQNLVHWSPKSLKEQQQGNDGGDIGCRGVETESSVQVLGGVTLGEEIKGNTKVHLRYSKVGQSVSKLPMSKFVSQNGKNFALLYLFHERVEKNWNFIVKILLVNFDEHVIQQGIRIDQQISSFELTNSLVATEPKHERIGMAGSFGSIHDEKIFQRIVQCSCQFEDTCFEVSVGKWFILVK